MYPINSKKTSFALKLILNIILFYHCLSFSYAIEIQNNRGLVIKRPAITRPSLPEYIPKKPKPGLKLPKLPEQKRTLFQSQGPKLYLKGVIFEGNSAFSSEQLSSIAKSFIDRKVTMTDLEELRYRLTRYYTDRGYSNSGAIIKPKQIVKNGMVIFQIIEGNLSEVHVKGTERLNPAYVTDRIWSDKNEVFNTQKLQEYFQLLLYDPMIERMDGSLIPGPNPGSAILDLKVNRAKAYGLNLTIDNSRSPSTGSERGRLSAKIFNLTGFGDRLDIASEFSKGATNWAVNFELPINQYDTRASFRYDTTESSVIRGPLSGIDIENKYRTLEFSLNHPIWRNLHGHFLLGSTFSFRNNKSFLLGQPFPFSPSDEKDGTSSVSVLRLWQDYQHRSIDSVLALRSSFNFGLDLFDATIHSSNLADGKFASWLGQLQYAQKVLDETQIVFRSDIQLSNDPLLSLEQFSLGGINTVRGYRENTLIRDQAYLMSVELRYPIYNNINYGQFKLTPFVDYGNAWNYKQFKNREYLLSVGIGITWQAKKQIDAALYIAHDIKKAPEVSEFNIQDNGIHFRINMHIL